MSIETFLLWIAVGAISGFLASLVAGGGFGLIGEIIIGIVGAFIGSYVFSALGWHAPFGGIAGTIVVAFVGAVILLLVLRLFRSVRNRRA